VDANTAAKFIEGQDSIHLVTDDEHLESEMRNAMGKTKRCFGNVHNKSNFRLEYGDAPGYRTEHHMNGLRWGDGHGRKKFPTVEVDHLKDAGDDGGTLFSQSGAVLVKTKRIHVQGQLDKNMSTSGTVSKGNSLSPRHFVPVKDNITHLLEEDIESEHSNTLCVTGMRRKSETIRPHSARRFPQKDFERVTPRSATPRAKSEARMPLADRSLWKK